MNNEFSVFHWLVVLMILFVMMLPAARILRRTGHSAGWSIFVFVPVVNWILLWWFAFKSWPTDKTTEAK